MRSYVLSGYSILISPDGEIAPATAEGFALLMGVPPNGIDWRGLALDQLGFIVASLRGDRLETRFSLPLVTGQGLASLERLALSMGVSAVSCRIWRGAWLLRDIQVHMLPSWISRAMEVRRHKLSDSITSVMLGRDDITGYPHHALQWYEAHGGVLDNASFTRLWREKDICDRMTLIDEHQVVRHMGADVARHMSQNGNRKNTRLVSGNHSGYWSRRIGSILETMKDGCAMLNRVSARVGVGTPVGVDVSYDVAVMPLLVRKRGSTATWLMTVAQPVLSPEGI